MEKIIRAATLVVGILVAMKSIKSSVNELKSIRL